MGHATGTLVAGYPGLALVLREGKLDSSPRVGYLLLSDWFPSAWVAVGRILAAQFFQIDSICQQRQHNSSSRLR